MSDTFKIDSFLAQEEERIRKGLGPSSLANDDNIWSGAAKFLALLFFVCAWAGIQWLFGRVANLWQDFLPVIFKTEVRWISAAIILILGAVFYLFKKYFQLYYGALELAASAATAFDAAPKLFLPDDKTASVLAFTGATYVAVRGITNVRESLNEWRTPQTALGHCRKAKRLIGRSKNLGTKSEAMLLVNEAFRQMETGANLAKLEGYNQPRLVKLLYSAASLAIDCKEFGKARNLITDALKLSPSRSIKTKLLSLQVRLPPHIEKP